MNNKTPDFQKLGQQLIKDAQTIGEVEMINFVMENFEKQAWQGSSVEGWKQRSDGSDPGRNVLIKTGHLRDSVEVSQASTERVVVSASAKYAAIHNEGGMVTLPITQKMRRYFWFMYWRTQNEKFKWMALTKKSAFSFEMPKRQFMGHSEIFMERIEFKLITYITKRFKAALK